MTVCADPYQVTISSDHPCLPGHFPGRPIVPAVVVLDEVRALINETFSDQQIVAIDHCKFQDFVLPDQAFTIELATTDSSSLDFACRAVDDGRLLAKGRFSMQRLVV